MSDPTAFITMAQVQADLSSLTTTRLQVTEQHLLDACSAVVSLIRGSSAEWPAVIPHEWKSLARQWLCARLFEMFPEYFRAKMPSLAEVEKRIATRARVEPSENKTYVASKGIPGDDWDPYCGGGCWPCS